MPPLAVIEFDSMSSSPLSDNALITVVRCDTKHQKDDIKRAAQKSAPAAAVSAKKETKPSSKARKVRFKSSVRVRKISTHRNFSDEERANTWYSSTESKEIRADAVKTVKKLMKGKDVDFEGSDDCSRGLEFRTPKKNKIRQGRKVDIMWTVLGEQEYQWARIAQQQRQQPDGKKKELNHERISSIYTSCNKQCIREAIRRAARDEMEAWY